MYRTFVLLAVAALPALADAAEPARKPNVLFIAVDDLNHWVGHLGRNPVDLGGPTEPVGVGHGQVHDDHIGLIDHCSLDRFASGGRLADQFDGGVLGRIARRPSLTTG